MRRLRIEKESKRNMLWVSGLLLAAGVVLWGILWPYLRASVGIIRAGGLTWYLRKRFLSNSKEPIPPVVREWVMGRRMTFVTDLSMLRSVLEDRRGEWSSFGLSVLPILERLFRIPAALALDDRVGEATKEASHLLMKGPEIDAMFDRAVKITLPMLDQTFAGAQKQTIDVVDFLSRLAFTATVTSIFGEEMASDPALYTSFLTYDQGTKLLAAGVPWFIRPKVTAAFNHIGNASSTDAENSPTRAVRARHEVCVKAGLDPAAQNYKDLMASFVWASLANTVPSSVWIVMHLGALPHIQEEIFQEMRDQELSRTNAFKSQILNGCWLEVLRLHWDGFYMRTVMAPEGAKLEDESGRTHDFATGEAILGYAALFHRSPKYFPDPERFDPTRWTGDVVPPRPLAFGGGNNMCPGRLFVQAEVSLFVLCLISRFRFTLVDEIPAPSPDKGGFGLSIPSANCRMSFERRE